jgi:hypothetical protein
MQTRTGLPCTVYTLQTKPPHAGENSPVRTFCGNRLDAVSRVAGQGACHRRTTVADVVAPVAHFVSGITRRPGHTCGHRRTPMRRARRPPRSAAMQAHQWVGLVDQAVQSLSTPSHTYILPSGCTAFGNLAPSSTCPSQSSSNPLQSLLPA